MHPVLLLLVKALVGGIGVVAFAAVARMVRPKRLAGVFCAAPSVALGSLAVVVLSASAHEGRIAAQSSSSPRSPSSSARAAATRCSTR